MKPIAGTMVGYITEEPNVVWHGRLVGDKPTFFLRVHYPHKKEGWTIGPEAVQNPSSVTRRFPFVLHPSIAESVRAEGPWKGQFVVVTYFPEVVEKGEDYVVLLYATRVESLLKDFPKAQASEESLWLDLGSIGGEEIPDVELRR